jgi:hypothetical protein
MRPGQMPSSTEPPHSSAVQTLTREITGLEKSVDSWNNKYIVLLLLSIIVAALTLYAQFKTIRTARALSDKQAELDREKDRQLRSELSERDMRIAELRTASDKAQAELAASSARIKEAEAEVARAHTESKDAVAKVALADARSAEASAKAESFRLDIAQSNERAANAEERAAEATLALAKLKAPRVLPPVALERMKRDLTAFKGTPFDLYVSTDSEAVALMNAVERALSDCGWAPRKAAGNILVGDRAGIITSSGFGVEVLQEDWETLRAPATTLVDILNQSGLIMTISVATRTTENSGLIHVLVGSKPLN